MSKVFELLLFFILIFEYFKEIIMILESSTEKFLSLIPEKLEKTNSNLKQMNEQIKKSINSPVHYQNLNSNSENNEKNFTLNVTNQENRSFYKNQENKEMY
jgi:hypothetical protein